MAAPPSERVQVRKGNFRSGEYSHAGPPMPGVVGDRKRRRSVAPGLSGTSALALSPDPDREITLLDGYHDGLCWHMG